MEAKKSKLHDLLSQAIRFVGLSGIGWLLDFTVYTVLSFILDNLAVVNMLSSLVGASFVFLFSTRFVFRNSHKIPLVLKYLVYIIYQLLLIWLISMLLAQVNVFLLKLLGSTFLAGFCPTLSKVFVTPITMCLNFFVSKFVIEKI
ncbi:MAG: GtrA family protein [Oscillospiraceae bacterium]|nr:GtrA family protein [Oscillospiraceae bacterium]